MLNCGIDCPIASHIAKNISITKSYNKSISMLICTDNSKIATKSFNTYHLPPCSCHFINKLGHKSVTSLGHKWIKATNIDAPFFKKIFDIPTNSIPTPYIKKTAYEITCEIKKLVQNNILRNVSPFNLEDSLGSKEVIKCNFINEHQVI